MLRQKNRLLQRQQIERMPQFIYEPIQTVHGQRITKKYIKIKPIGQGSYSKCYLVKNTASQSTYAVKIIPKNKLQILLKEKLFYQIKIHQSLSHENIVYFDHWFEDEDYQYILMEYCSNGNLDTYAKKLSTALPQKQIKWFGWQIVKSIHYIHEQNILHRDLKLCNFYLTDKYQIKLGDFGFACQLVNSYDKKRESCGTPNYIAPQAISGFGYSFSSDVWSIGVILFRLKFGYCPFEGINVRETLEKVKLCEYRFPKNIKVSKQLKDLITQIFNINYDERITTAEILNHQFFKQMTEQKITSAPMLKQPQTKKSSSLFARIFNKSSQKKIHDQKHKQQLIINNSLQKQTKQVNRTINKSNSCQTLKEIKSIFKSKSKDKLRDHNTTINSFQTFNTINSSQQHSSILYSTRTSVRRNQDLKTSMFDTSYNNKQQNPNSRLSKLNQFVKNRAQNIDSSKIQKSTNFQKYNKNTQTFSKSDINLLQKISQQFLLPTSIQYQKDIIIIHYQQNIKQIIVPNEDFSKKKNLSKTEYQIKSFSETTIDTNNSTSYQKNLSGHTASQNIAQICYLLQIQQSLLDEDTRSALKIYRSDTLDQIIFDDLPKLITYIIDNKIKWNKTQTKQNESKQIYVDSCLCGSRIQSAKTKLCKNWNITRDGIILQYETKPLKTTKIINDNLGIRQFTISKMVSQKYFYLSTNFDTGKKLQMIYDYNGISHKLQAIQEVGILRMYMGWTKINSRSLSNKIQ